ncbi:MAG: ABC transporter ATP-binding protein [Ruminococcaceae bacterium]|nr:ABC transporter ATP-binding protein [Oscillospiraceae bacterium]
MGEKRLMVDVNDVTIRFNLASQKIDNLKEYFIKLVKRELMFQEFLAVKNINLKVHAGEAWGLIGTNGSGKSTLLKAISGILKPYKGNITVNGSVAPLIELGAGFDKDMTARENIFLNGCVLGHTQQYMKEHFDEIVDFAELHDFIDSPLKNFSSGMRARLGFAIATMVKPDILIVDEILAVGDIKFRQKCMKRMDEMLSNGTTLLYVSHSINEVKRLCDHALWINKGEEVMQGEVNEVCDAYVKEMKG